jgi:hypothetical protein
MEIVYEVNGNQDLHMGMEEDCWARLTEALKSMM